MNVRWCLRNRFAVHCLVLAALLACISLLSVDISSASTSFTLTDRFQIPAEPVIPAISGTVLKQGSPAQGKRIEFVVNSNTPEEVIVAVIETDTDGRYRFEAELDVTYELRGFGDIGNNELHEWVGTATPQASEPEITLPTIEIWYDGLLTPPDGASFDQEEINTQNPILFSWSPRSDADRYALWLRHQNDWSQAWRVGETTGTNFAFDGMLDGALITPMNYDWHLGMGLENGWWIWSGHQSMTITGEQIAASIEGYVTKQGTAIPDKFMEIVEGVGTPEEVIIATTETDENGYYVFSDLLTGTSYEIRGFGDMSANELQEWVRRVTPSTAEPDVTLPTLDIWYDGLVAPAEGTSLPRALVSARTPLRFLWTAREGADRYELWLRQRDDWRNAWYIAETTSTIAFSDGTLDGQPMAPMTYAWHVGMALDNGWWVWSENRSLEITLEEPKQMFLPLITAAE